MCSSTFDSAEVYEVHLRSFHNEEKLVCPECGKLFKLRGSLLIHLRVVHNSPEANHVTMTTSTTSTFNCRICNRKFGNLYRRYSYTNQSIFCNATCTLYLYSTSFQMYIGFFSTIHCPNLIVN